MGQDGGSIVIRIRTSSIIAAGRGDTGQILIELSQKLEKHSAQLDVPFVWITSPGICPEHKMFYIRDDKKRSWVCPHCGCGWETRDRAEIDQEIEQLWDQEIQEKHEMMKGNNHKGQKAKRYKKRKMPAGEIARRIPL